MPDVQRLSSHPSVVKTLGDLFTPPPSLTHFESLQLSLLDSSSNASCRVIDGSQEGASRSDDGGSAGGLQLSLLTGRQVRYIYLVFFTSGTHFTLLMGGRNGVCGKVLCRRCTDIFPVEGCGGRWGRGSYYMSQTNMRLYICIAIVRLLKNHKNTCLYLRETEL